MEKRHKTSYIISRILLTPTVISIVAFGIFCLASYLFTKEGQHNFTVGFPYKFYEQFRVSGSDTNNWGWLPMNFIIDGLLISTLSVAGYFYRLKNFYKPKDK
jgi:D-alanyl-lipoteichoic acid acyltransferase DltB (MBOAT superfamily)